MGPVPWRWLMGRLLRMTVVGILAWLGPLIQKRAVSLHPVAILMARLVMGSLFGILGVALATPLTAVVMTMAESLAPKPGTGE